MINSLDNPGVNYRYGVQGPDGAFTLSVTAAVPGGYAVALTASTQNTVSQQFQQSRSPLAIPPRTNLSGKFVEIGNACDLRLTCGGGHLQMTPDVPNVPKCPLFEVGGDTGDISQTAAAHPAVVSSIFAKNVPKRFQRSRRTLRVLCRPTPPKPKNVQKCSKRSDRLPPSRALGESAAPDLDRPPASGAPLPLRTRLGKWHFWPLLAQKIWHTSRVPLIPRWPASTGSAYSSESSPRQEANV